MSLFSKRNSLIRGGRKSNKGFTLVELIVVIVILAILIGVTIGGIYKYVSQSQKNTDINNASSLQSTLSSMCAEQDVYDWANTSGATRITFTWVDATTVDTSDSATIFTVATGKTAVSGTNKDDTPVIIGEHIKELCPDGLPASKTKKGFTFIIDPNKNTDGVGNPKVSVKALCES